MDRHEEASRSVMILMITGHNGTFLPRFKRDILALMLIEQGVVIKERNRTVAPCIVGRRTCHAPSPVAAERPRALQTTPTDDSVQNNTGP